MRQPIAPLDGQWRFHLGDDPDGRKGWAQPGFDDSSWPLVDYDSPWGEPGHRNPSSTAWYRAKVRLPADAPPLSLSVTWIIDSYQIFADGRQIGQFAGMPPHPYANDYQLRQLLPLPAPAPKEARTVTIAIRVWRWPRWAALNENGIGSILIGDSELLQNRLNVATHADAWEVVDVLQLIALEGLAAAASLAFFAMRRKEREYLWFGTSLLFVVASRGLMVYVQSHPVSVQATGLLSNLLNFFGTIAEIAFYFTLLRGRRNWFFWLMGISLAASAVASLLMTLELGNFTTLIQITYLLGLPQSIWILTLLVQSTRRGLADARLLLFPVLLQQIVLIMSDFFDTATILGVANLPPQWFKTTSQWPFQFSVPDIADALFLMAMIAIFIYRFTRTRLLEDEHQRERDAARSIQQVLVPENTPLTPGFLIQSIYKPFGEVGGDFFQVLPVGDSVLIAIGDVSGKGLPAAMLVSLLVGALQTLIEITTSPAQLLAGLNARVLGRSSGGFTTCLILRADPGGLVTIANAGHIPPYLHGVELPCAYGLPLGLTNQAAYEESTFTLSPNQQLTLVTDGVVEARNSAGELFGFEQTAAVSKNSAEQIARTAQEFGQDDDITVVSVAMA